MCLLQYCVDERDESSRQKESDSEDEQPKAKICSPPPSSQRVPMFPGLSPQALIVRVQVPCSRIYNIHMEWATFESIKICFPHMLQAQLKKKTSGGAAGGRGREEAEEDVRRESRGGHNEEAAAPSPSQLSSTPRSTAHLAGAARVLPPIGGSEEG